MNFQAPTFGALVDWAALPTYGLRWRFTVFSERSRLEDEGMLWAGRWKEDEGQPLPCGRGWLSDIINGKMLLYATRAAPMRPLCRVGVFPYGVSEDARMRV